MSCNEKEDEGESEVEIENEGRVERARERNSEERQQQQRGAAATVYALLGGSLSGMPPPCAEPAGKLAVRAGCAATHASSE